MSKNKKEDGAKKIVKEETEPIKRSDAPGQKPEKPEDPGGFRDLFEDMWSELENYEDSKKGMNSARQCPFRGAPG